MNLAVLGSGVVQGFAIALVAVGFTVIYSATGVVNFANGQLMVLGGYVGWWALVAVKLPLPLVIVAAVLSGAALGILSDLIVIGPLRSSSLLVQVIALLALTYVLNAAYVAVFGAEAKTFPPYAPTTALVPGLNWSAMDLVIMASCTLIVGLLLAFLYLTDAGTSMRATADNRIGASIVGINPRRVARLAWGLGGGIAALSGVLIMPKLVLTVTTGPSLTFVAFAAVVLGGFGSLTGAVVGALLVGIANALVDGLFAAGYEPLVSLAVMLVVLTLRPSGLIGERA